MGKEKSAETIMSASVVSDPVVLVVAAAPEASSSAAATASKLIALAKCECCGLTEECTPAYIERVRERYHGKWICGLCAEAVKDEVVRSERLISTEEAIARHMNFCKNFVSSPPPDPTMHLISAMRQILRRSLDSTQGSRSTPASPTNGVRSARNRTLTRSLARSDSCFSALSG